MSDAPRHRPLWNSPLYGKDAKMAALIMEHLGAAMFLARHRCSWFKSLQISNCTLFRVSGPQSQSSCLIVCEINTPRRGSGRGEDRKRKWPSDCFKSCWRAALKWVHEGLWRNHWQLSVILRWWLCWLWLWGVADCQFVGSVGGEWKSLTNENLAGQGWRLLR